ncbi:MAG: carboxypeptidase regulatory-like domain-containing protein [Deltaproteobacteria bacterium]|nr:carboxypeptidase regulatory-like domain-containing protein [Deltaproteobacteria bacterium]
MTDFIGDLRDASLFTPVSTRRIELVLKTGTQGFRRQVLTNPAGRFSFTVATAPGPHKIQIAFAGDRYFLPTTLPHRWVDVSKPVVSLTLDLPRRFSDSQERFPVRVEARAEGHPVAIPLSVALESPRQHVALAHLQTRTDGPLSVYIPTRLLGAPGVKVLRVHYAESTRFNSAQATARFTLVTPITLTLTAHKTPVAADGILHLQGQAHDRRGPIGGVSISIQAMGRHRASATTTSQADFTVDLAMAPFPPGVLDLQGVITPLASWHDMARSPRLQVRVLAPHSVSLRLYVFPAAATLVILFLALLWHRRDRIFRPRRPRQRVASASPQAHDARQTRSLGGIVRGRGRHIQRQDFSIAGIVWDPIDAIPIAGARLRFRLSDGTEHLLISDTAGHFGTDDLPRGDVALGAKAKGYVAERVHLTIPHRGGLRNLRVRLVPVRVRLLEIYRDATVDLLPKPRLWARWTPQDLLSHRPAKEKAGNALVSLSALLEEAYWSQSPAAEEAIDHAQAWAKALDDRPRQDRPSR